jgi:hypothetical protein
VIYEIACKCRNFIYNGCFFLPNTVLYTTMSEMVKSILTTFVVFFIIFNMILQINILLTNHYFWRMLLTWPFYIFFQIIYTLVNHNDIKRNSINSNTSMITVHMMYYVYHMWSWRFAGLIELCHFVVRVFCRTRFVSPSN